MPSTTKHGALSLQQHFFLSLYSVASASPPLRPEQCPTLPLGVVQVNGEVVSVCPLSQFVMARVLNALLLPSRVESSGAPAHAALFARFDVVVMMAIGSRKLYGGVVRSIQRTVTLFRSK
ncbi:hypothetical protein EDB87DRAFT_1424930 [Lactarius vividus]|nr:hypothetical protein EDB87DRAFT_1424930 [Lactarius vividus]